LPYWDMVMVVLLIYTATVTPYEVGFHEEINVPRDGVNAMWIINRIVDGCFLLDILLTCNTMCETDPHPVHGPKWLGKRRLITWTYMQSPWAYVDVISILPFYTLGWSSGDAADMGNATNVSIEGSGAAGLSSLRLIKLLRMLKLARMLKAAAYFAPLIKDVLMVRFEMTYASLKVLSLFTWLLLFTHLQACFWGLFATFFAEDEPTWIKEFTDSHTTMRGKEPEPWEVYAAALYWSAMTVTSIGYGEMLPANSAERLLCTFFMIISGMVWAYILSTAAGIAATLNPNTVLFHNTMDQLNYFMRERSLPGKLRKELRHYFEVARHVREINDDANLLEQMPSLMQGRVAFAAHKDWLQRVWYFQHLPDSRESREFNAHIAKNLKVRALVAEERAPIGQLYVLRRGMVVKNWHFMRAGRVWGDDMIIDALHLIDHSQAVAVTYCEVFILSRESLDQVASTYPVARDMIEKAARRLRMQRALLIFLCEQMGTNPRSFIRQKHASNYTFTSSQVTTQQKIDAMHSVLVTERHWGDGRQPSKLSEMLRIRKAAFTAGGVGAGEQSQPSQPSLSNGKSSAPIVPTISQLALAPATPPPKGLAPAAALSPRASASRGNAPTASNAPPAARSRRSETDPDLHAAVSALSHRVDDLAATMQHLGAHAQQQTAMMARLDAFLKERGAQAPTPNPMAC